MEYVRKPFLMALNIVDYVRKCPYGFKRHAWQSVQSGRMSELFGREAENADMRKPESVSSPIRALFVRWKAG